jgi:MFS family permease
MTSPTTMHDKPARRPAWRFWAVSYSLLVLLTGTNLATPLYGTYQRLFGFSAVIVTVIFAAYVAALIPSLLIAGPLSDAIGRRAVLAPAVIAAAVGAGVLALADSAAWLFAGRVIQGLAVGAASGALTATLAETEPRGDHRRAALSATVASAGGLGVGPLLAGILAEYGPMPRRLPFLAEIAVLIPAVLVMATLPEQSARTRWRPRRPQIPATARGVFLTGGSANFLAFAVIGLFLALIPAYVASLAHSTNLVLGGGAVAVMIACSVIAQITARGRPSHATQTAGLCLLATGLILLAVAGAVSTLALLLVATAVAGAGQGLVFLAGITEVTAAAPPERRADVLSSFYVIVYLGVGLPVIGAGFLATTIGLLHSVQYFALAVAALCPALTVTLARRNRQARLAVCDRPAEAEPDAPEQERAVR